MVEIDAGASDAHHIGGMTCIVEDELMAPVKRWIDIIKIIKDQQALVGDNLTSVGEDIE